MKQVDSVLPELDQMIRNDEERKVGVQDIEDMVFASLNDDLYGDENLDVKDDNDDNSVSMPSDDQINEVDDET